MGPYKPGISGHRSVLGREAPASMRQLRRREYVTTSCNSPLFPEYSRKRVFFSRMMEMQYIANYDDGEEKEEKNDSSHHQSAIF